VATHAGKKEILFYYSVGWNGCSYEEHGMMNMDTILVFNLAFPHCTLNCCQEETITVLIFMGANTAVAQRCMQQC
jgi:hypothetical protein